MSTPLVAKLQSQSMVARRPRIAFVGLGWIGRNRLQSIARTDLIEVAAISDADQAAVESCSALISNAEIVPTFDEILTSESDGVVIATPNAYHHEQSIAALEAGMAVFCQKPLGRTTAETKEVIDVAKRANRLLAVDLSYRFIPAMQQLKRLITSGELGEIFAVDLTFHNAYGPGKDWFYQRELSGGGCVIDLGIHLLDLLVWTLRAEKLQVQVAALFKDGELLRAPLKSTEDFATAMMQTNDKVNAKLNCSWNLNLGCDAEISATFYGTRGSGTLQNVGGSFFDFSAHVNRKTSRENLTTDAGSDWEWGVLALQSWCERLRVDNSYDSEIEKILIAAEAIDEIYDSAAS